MALKMALTHGVRWNQGKRRCAAKKRLHVESLEGRLLLAADVSPAPALEYLPGEILISLQRTDVSQDTHESTTRTLNAASTRLAPLGVTNGRVLLAGGTLFANEVITRWDLPAGIDPREAVNDVLRLPGVAHAEPNFIWHVADFPNDPLFDDLWGLHNTGQSGGTPDADIDAHEAWVDFGTGSRNVIVGVIDTGIDYTHPDLAANIWRNPGECLGPNGECIANGQDNDGNGYKDDFHGINAITNSGDPMDDNYHGTHVAGTIGAAANNGIGVAGVNHEVSIAACKFLSASGSGFTSDAVKCFDYFNQLKLAGHNIVLTNNSWGGGGESQLLFNAMKGPSGMAPILHVAAAGNSNLNTDVIPHYPSNYNLANIISVAATDRNDAYASFTNYGPTSVHLAAPGVSILSTGLSHQGTGYRLASGTSMASPHVAGAAALLSSIHPTMSATQLKQALMEGTDIVGADDWVKSTVTNGRLNIHQTLLNIEDLDEIPPAAVTDLSIGDRTMRTATLTWTATGDDGFDGTARMYDVRYSTQPITAANWAAATQAIGEPRPRAPGTTETFQVRGLERATTYHFAMKVSDNKGNESPLSNLAVGATQSGTVVFSDGFESGLGQWTAQSPWGLTSYLRCGWGTLGQLGSRIGQYSTARCGQHGDRRPNVGDRCQQECLCLQ